MRCVSALKCTVLSRFVSKFMMYEILQVYGTVKTLTDCVFPVKIDAEVLCIVYCMCTNLIACAKAKTKSISNQSQLMETESSSRSNKKLKTFRFRSLIYQTLTFTIEHSVVCRWSFWVCISNGIFIKFLPESIMFRIY